MRRRRSAEAVIVAAKEWRLARQYATSEAMKGVLADPACWDRLATAEAKLSTAVAESELAAVPHGTENADG